MRFPAVRRLAGAMGVGREIPERSEIWRESTEEGPEANYRGVARQTKAGKSWPLSGSNKGAGGEGLGEL